MSKPEFHHPALRRMRSATPTATMKARSRRCAPAVATIRSGCDHRACFELRPAAPSPRQVVGDRLLVEDADLFPRQVHGFNSVHGRMPSVLTGANLANRDLIYLGVSGDGDSASIGFGQFAHAIRRGVEHGLYRREQRRLWPDQRPVLGDRRPGLEVQARRDQYRLCHRSGRHRAAARRRHSWRARSPATRSS